MATSTPISTGAVKSKLLLGLDDTALRHVRDAAQVRGMGPNENVTVAGARPDNLFLLQAGRARSFIHTEAGSGISIDITNEHLSSLSDISSFTASRLLSRWQRDGKLVKERGRVTLLAPESLMLG